GGRAKRSRADRAQDERSEAAGRRQDRSEDRPRPDAALFDLHASLRSDAKVVTRIVLELRRAREAAHTGHGQIEATRELAAGDGTSGCGATGITRLAILRPSRGSARRAAFGSGPRGRSHQPQDGEN